MALSTDTPVTTPERGVLAAPRSGGRRRRARTGKTPLLFLLAPYTIFLVAFGLLPVVYAVWTSLTVDRPDGTTEFAWFESWGAVIDDSRLVPAIGHVGSVLLLWLPCMLILCPLLALLLHARLGRFASTMRFIYYLPGAVTGAAVALLWLFMVSPGLSPFSPLLPLLGIDQAVDAVDPDRLPGLFTVMAFAVTSGSWVVILLGALVNIPEEVLEAAQIDGARPAQTAISIKLPYLRRSLILMLIACFAYGAQLFVEPTVLVTAFQSQVSSTWSLNQLAYSYATQEGSFGKASALSVMLLLAVLIPACILIFRTRFYAIDDDEK